MGRQRLSSSQVAERSRGQFSAGWVRQLTSGRIDRPGRDKLTVLSEILNVELADLLSLSDQLGAVVELRQAYAPATQPEWAIRLERKLDLLVARAGVDPIDVEDEAEARRLVEEALELMRREREAAGQ